MSFKKIENVKAHIYRETETICPRCGSNEFKEVDCGPDTYDDDIAYSSDICESCGLWWDGWREMWLVDCSIWREAEDCDEYIEGGE